MPSRMPPVRSGWRDFRGVLRPAGAVICGLAFAQAACAVAGGAYEWSVLPRTRDPIDVVSQLAGALATAFVGMVAYLYGRRHRAALSRREAVLAVVIIWMAAGTFGAVPFVLGAGMSPIDAFFESVSGFSTTGATVVRDAERTLSPALMLWRSLTQWLGGMGIVVLFVAVFPSLGAGGKHMFKGEVPGATTEGLKPRIAETSFTLWKLYAAFTIIDIVLLGLLGMPWFEAVCHGFATLSTGGFSTRNASIAAFDSYPIEAVTLAFMFLGGINYGLFYALFRGRSVRAVLRNTELRVYAGVTLLFVLALTLGLLSDTGGDVVEAARRASFRVVATLSSTSFAIDDYAAYPGPVLMLFLVMMFVGGCSGSTAGGFKIERVVLMAKSAWAELRRSFRPSVVQVVRLGRSAVPADVLTEVAVLFGVYAACLFGGAFVVVLFDGVPIPTALGAMLSCLSNMGPAPFHQGADDFAAYGAASKMIFALAMIVGRLEFFTVFALLVPDFWKR